MSYESEVLADEPLAWWRQGDTTDLLLDASGNDRHGVQAFGAAPPTAASVVPTDTTLASAWPGDGGVSKSAVVTSGSWMNTPTITVEMWYRPGTVTGNRWLVGRDNNGADGVWRLDTFGAHVRWIFEVGGLQVAQANDVLTIGTPVYLRAAYDGTEGKLYVDDVLVATQAAVGSLPSTTREIRFGRASDGLFPTGGDIDEVAVYGSVLSDERGTAHYLAGTTSTGEPLDAVLAAVAPRPVAAVSLFVPPALTVEAVAPRPVAALGLVVPVVLTLAGTTPRPEVTLGVYVPTQARLAGTAPAPVATFTAFAEIPIVPAPVVEVGASVVVAQAFGPVTMQGTQPVFSVSEAAIPRARQQIIVDGVDVTFFRSTNDRPYTASVTYTLLEPLLYGPGALDLPQVVACHESDKFGVGELSWLREDAPVEVRYVLDNPDGTTTLTSIRGYKGFIVAFDTTGSGLSVELGGEANGRASLRDWPVPKFPRINDIGHQAARLIRALGLPFEPNLGPETGIEVMTTGGVSHLDQIEDIIAKAWTRAGRQWSIMPDRNGVYRMRRKDDTTIHATVFFDNAHTVQKLRRDKAEEPNRIFATAVGPNGMRIDGAVYPGLVQGRPPAFPGHMEFGDTGPGVRMLILKLQGIGYLKLEDAGGGYDDDVFKAVVELQKDAGLFDDGFSTPTVPGEVNQLTWNALYDLDVTTLSVEGAHVEPMAQTSKVNPWRRTGSGNIAGPNPNYDASVVPVDRTLAMGQAGMNTSQVREAARTVLHDSDEPNWLGTITFNTGALIRGEKGIGATLTPGDVMDARELEPGMNVWAPAWGPDGTLFHIAAADPTGEPSITVDTRFRDAMEVWQILIRNRESRSDPTRSGNRKHRASTLVKDSIGEWDQVGGLLDQDVDLDAGWNVFPVVAAYEGTISRLRIRTDPPVEFITAVFGESVGPGTLQAMVGNPLTKKGTRALSRESVRLQLERDYELLYVAGDYERPCGYWPKDKRAEADELDLTPTEPGDEDDVPTTAPMFVQAPLTGKWQDDAGFAYRSRVKHMVWVAVYAERATTIEAGRIMWPQLEAGV